MYIYIHIYIYTYIYIYVHIHTHDSMRFPRFRIRAIGSGQGHRASMQESD